MKLEQDVCNGSKRKQLYKCGWLWQTGYYAKTKQKGGRGMREGWEYKKLGDVCQVVTGSTPKTNISEYWDGNYPWVTPAELKGDVYISDTARHITEEAIAHTNLTLLPIGTVLLSSRAPIGKVAITTIEMYCNQGFKNLICSDAINNKYLYLWLSGKTEYLNSLGRGATFKEISKTIVENVIIPLPPLSIQKSIVSELDKINELIRLKKEQLKDYDNLAQSIFYEMFGDPVVNEKGWEVKKLIETVVLECTISYGIVQPGDGVEDGIPVVRPIDLTGTFVSTNNLKKTTEKISSSYSRTILTGKELLVCVRGTTGVCSLVTDELKGCNVTRGITPLLFNDNTDRWFMYYQFQMPQIKCIIADYTKGITLKQINMADFRKIPVILPPLPLQQLFAQRIELIEKQKAEIQSTIADLETLLASRMQYWFG